MQELSKSLESEQLKNRNAEERFQALETELQVTKTSLNEITNVGETELGEWKNKLEILERQNAESRQQLEKLNEEKTRFETQFNEAQALLNRSQDAEVTESRDLKAKLEEMTRRHAESQEQMSKLNEEKERLQLQLADSLASTNQTKHDGDAELNNLKVKLDERQEAKNEE
jgi:chromosome segregation ATPase